MLKSILPILFLLSSYMANDDNSQPLVFPNSPFQNDPKPIIFSNDIFISKPEIDRTSLDLGKNYYTQQLVIKNNPFLTDHKPIIFFDNILKSKPKKSTGSLALGSDNKSGLLWVVMCMNTSHGNVPGKLDKDDNGFYAWGGKEHKCLEWEQVQGILYSSQNEIPSDCEAKGRQNDSSESHHNVVVPTEYGMIPGKGLKSSNTAWYGYDGEEHFVNDNFYYVC